ncbi:MAG: ThiF family adenylyltransferase [Candidatus Eremiobacteraeota bacterium]|nr:ThiF family adenylyltransferase [Candidatus Eremiobacteraeota bacterium]
MTDLVEVERKAMEAEKRLLICGAGTLGGNLAENLARMGIKRFTVLDRDRVEERNLANQPYSTADVGQPKAKALAFFLSRACRAEVTSLNKDLVEGNSDHLLKDCGLVIDAFDNSMARGIVKDTAARLSIPCVHAGISNDGYGEVIWNERYRVPEGGGEDPCERPLSRNLSLLVVSVATEVILAYLEEGTMRNYTVTLKDLAITEYC